MKKLVSTITLFVLITISVNAQEIINHVANSTNSRGHITTINNEMTNGKKDVILIVTQKYGVYNDNEIGVWYSNGKWRIFNQNRKTIPRNALFNVLVLPKNTGRSFVHTTTNSNTSKNVSTLNSALTNNKSNVLVFVTQNYGKYNTSNVGLWFNGGKWKIYNENIKQNIPIGTKFNVLVLNSEKNKIGSLDLFALVMF